jgi:serine/threonine-protein kinase
LILIPVTFWLVSTAGNDREANGVRGRTIAAEPIPPLPRPLPPTPLPVARTDASPPPAAPIDDAGPAPVAAVVAPPPTEPAKTDAAPPPPTPPAVENQPAKTGPTKHRPRAKSTGVLVLRIRPYADVHVDGRRRGLTPMPPISLPAGRHRVRLVNDSLGRSVIRNVLIEPGKRTTLSVNLSR